ncbi:MAG: FAD-dependent oxidoreductase [Sphingobacteriales bacterium 50-39]|nr:FAD-binding oxidoreductase [Sphingobacteriales bacterium]OJW53016.1 MAG: FAD-dependent oxidoreductase [Sphingobacteriales bacterium 50-39]
MIKDVLVIGQGICGTFLTWWLEQKGLSFVVIDQDRPSTASRSAAGLINPVTGRRIVKTWMIDELLSFAEETYASIGGALQLSCLKPARVIDFFPTAQMRLAFLKRLEEDPQYLELPADEYDWSSLFHYELGYGMVTHCYLADLPGLLPAWRQCLIQQNVLRPSSFAPGSLVVNKDNVQYEDITARHIIFCDGIESFHSPYFSRLPFAPNKGEALILDIPDWPSAPAVGSLTPIGPSPTPVIPIFKKGMTLAPWKDGLFWVGSSYEWSFTNPDPTETFRQRTEAFLKDWLKPSFRILDHIASVRPATLERRPFVGFHPQHPAVGILNGMGTKGCSLAPYFAHQLVEHMVNGKPIRPDADVRRFTKILSR